MRVVYHTLGVGVLVLVALAAYGFFTDDAATEAAARAAACAGRGPRCAPRIARLEKTPLWRTMQYRVGSDTVTVRCVRSAYLVGEHRCTAQ